MRNSNHDTDSREWELQKQLNLNPFLKEKLNKLNKGYNLLNINEDNRKYYIEVKLYIDLNLKEEQVRIDIDHNLPIGYSHFWSGGGLQRFLDYLEAWAVLPYCIPKQNNLKSTISYWSLGDSVAYRQETIYASDIKITVHELAEKYLKKQHGISDFRKKVYSILDMQRNASKEEEKAISKWVYFLEKIDFLEKSAGVAYGYRSKEKFKIQANEYNADLKKAEKEMKKLAKSFSLFKLSKVSFNYISKDKPAEDDYCDNEDEEYADDEYCL